MYVHGYIKAYISVIYIYIYGQASEFDFFGNNLRRGGREREREGQLNERESELLFIYFP